MAKSNTQANDMPTTANNWQTPGTSNPERYTDAPEAIDIPVVLWHVARCTGVEDFDRAAEDFGGEGAA